MTTAMRIIPPNTNGSTATFQHESSGRSKHKHASADQKIEGCISGQGLASVTGCTDQEAKSFSSPKGGVLSPYQRGSLAALRELTGRDTAPTLEACEKLLNMPGPGVKCSAAMIVRVRSDRLACSATRPRV